MKSSRVDLVRTLLKKGGDLREQRVWRSRERWRHPRSSRRCRTFHPNTISKWHNGDIHDITQIDVAGRLVVPKALRDALHLRAGDRLRVRTEGDTLVLEPEPVYARIRMAKDGWPLLESAGPDEPLPAEFFEQAIAEVREERHHRAMGDDQ